MSAQSTRQAIHGRSRARRRSDHAALKILEEPVGTNGPLELLLGFGARDAEREASRLQAGASRDPVSPVGIHDAPGPAARVIS